MLSFQSAVSVHIFGRGKKGGTFFVVTSPIEVIAYYKVQDSAGQIIVREQFLLYSMLFESRDYFILFAIRLFQFSLSGIIHSCKLKIAFPSPHTSTTRERKQVFMCVSVELYLVSSESHCLISSLLMMVFYSSKPSSLTEHPHWDESIWYLE